MKRELNAACAIDLHNVLFAYSYREAIKLILRELPVWACLKMLVRPFFFWRLYETSRRTRVLDDIFERVEKEYPQAQALWPFGHKLANCQLPQQPVVNLLQKLKQHGNTLILFSNISPLSLQDLKKRFPEVFALFDAEVTPEKSDGYCQKSNPLFFKRLKMTQDRLGCSALPLIVVDDRKTIVQAEKNGMVGIQFVSSAQLERSLNQYLEISAS